MKNNHVKSVSLKWNALPTILEMVQYDTGNVIALLVRDVVIPGGTTAKAYFQKPSGKIVYKESEITVSGQQITIPVDNQAIAEVGNTLAQVTLYNGTDTLSTFDFTIKVYASRKDWSIQNSTTVIDSFEQAVQSAIEEIGNVLDPTLALPNKAAEAKATGDALNNIKEDLSHLADTVGVQLYDFQLGMWNGSTGEIVENAYTIVCKAPYHNETINVEIESDMRIRAYYLDQAGSGTGDTGWKDGSKVLSNSNPESKFIVICIRYTDSRAISGVWELESKTKITSDYTFGLVKDVNILKDTSRMHDVNLVNLESGEKILFDANDFWYLKYHMGVTNGTTGLDQDSTTRVASNHVPYDNTEIIVEIPDTIKSRIYYFREDGSVFANTGWVNGNKTYKASATEIDSFCLNVAYADDSNIEDMASLIGKIIVKKAGSTQDRADIMATIGTFENFGVIGDSYSRGRYKYNDANHGYSDYNAWGKMIAREVGNECLLLGLGGTNTRTWLTAPENRDGGPIKLMASEPQDLYFLCLGINDTSLGLDYIGTVADIKADYTQNEDTFYGNYGKIIGMCKEKNPKALFMISELVATNDPAMVDAYNTAIDGVAAHFKIPVIKPTDDVFFNSAFYSNNKSYGHPTGLTYGGMAKAYMRLMSKCMHDNAAYFRGYNVPAPNDGKYRYWQGF